MDLYGSQRPHQLYGQPPPQPPGYPTQPQGYPPQPQGYPPQQQGPYGPELPGYYGPEPQPQPPRRQRRREGFVKSWLIPGLLGILAIPVLAALGYAYNHYKGDPSTVAKVGDCVSGSDADQLKVVSCTDPAVTYKVLGRIENVSQSSTYRNDICDRYPKSDTVFWEGPEGGGYRTGTVLCLAEKKK